MSLILSPPISFLLHNSNPIKPNNLTFPIKISPICRRYTSNFINFSSARPLRSSPNSLFSSSSSLQSIKPYLLSEWKLILQGWAFGAISVLSLSQIVPRAGKFSLILSDVSAIKCDGMMLASLFSVRLVANYLQQAYLWEAAFNLTYKIRVYVFERVLERDLGFFDGGASAGDIAHRITTEAADVSDTVFSLLNTILPSTLQLSAMGAQMLMISPVLSLISALAIPSVALAITFLGARLQRISRKAHLSIAAVSSYLNETRFSELSRSQM